MAPYSRVYRPAAGNWPVALWQRIASWGYSANGPRDLRLDLLRGFCLFAMIVDHVGDQSLLHWLTGGNRFFVSAAEGFVFIAGLLIGQIYRPIVEREGLRTAAHKAFQRALTLYKLMIVLTLLFFYLGWALGQWWASGTELAQPLGFVWRVLTFSRAFFVTDVLMLYTLLLLAVPLALWVLRRGYWWLLLAGSWLLWAGYQLAPGLVGQPLAQLDRFHPAAWQVLFIHGVVCGYHRQRLAALFSARMRLGLFLATALLFGWLLLLHANNSALPGLASTKETLAAGRLVAAAIVFPFAYLLVSYGWEPVRRAAGWLLLPLGQHSLYAYTMHVLAILAVAWLLGGVSGALPLGLALHTLADALAVLAIWWLIRHKVLLAWLPR